MNSLKQIKDLKEILDDFNDFFKGELVLTLKEKDNFIKINIINKKEKILNKLEYFVDLKFVPFGYDKVNFLVWNLTLSNIKRGYFRVEKKKREELQVFLEPFGLLTTYQNEIEGKNQGFTIKGFQKWCLNIFEFVISEEEINLLLNN